MARPKGSNNAFNHVDPTTVHEQAGVVNPTYDPDDPTSLIPVEHIPPPPDYYLEPHREMYTTMGRLMSETGVLTQRQMETLLTLSWLGGEIARLQRLITVNGHTQTTRLGGSVRTPESSAYLSMLAVYTRLLHECGFTPAGASRVKPGMVSGVAHAPPGAAPGNPFASFAPTP